MVSPPKIVSSIGGEVHLQIIRKNKGRGKGILPNNQQQILEHEVFNRLTKLTTHRQSLERLRKINISMNSKDKIKQKITEAKRKLSTQEKLDQIFLILEEIRKLL